MPRQKLPRNQREYVIDCDADDESSVGTRNTEDNMNQLTDFAQLARTVSASSTRSTGYKPAAIGNANPTPQYWRSNTASGTGDSLNISDLLENETIDAHCLDTPQRSVQMFQPSEITGRSTECINAGGMSEQEVGSCCSLNSPSVEQILAASFSEDVRRMADQLRAVKVRNSYGGRTADMSMASEGTPSISRNSMFDWGEGYRNNISRLSARLDADEASFNSTKVDEILARGEKEWDAEYATIPNQTGNNAFGATSSNYIVKNSAPVDQSDFYGSHYVTPSNSEQDFSIGQYFQRRCEDVAEMIPQNSPRKLQTAYGLLDQPSSVSKTKSDLSKKAKNPPEHKSIMSVSQIASHLENQSDSPRTLVMKLLNEKMPKSPVQAVLDPSPRKVESSAQLEIQSNNRQRPTNEIEGIYEDRLEIPTDTLTSSTDTPPLADILYITKPLPLSTNTSANMHSSSVNILKFEEFIGDTNKLLKVAKKLAPSQRHVQNKYSELTPKKSHIVLKSSIARKEADAAILAANKENTIEGSMLSDTVSCTDSVFEISSPIKVPIIHIEEITTEPLYQAPDHSKRKRTRQSPPRSPGVAQIVEAPASPFTNKLPPLPDGKTHVLQSKSRLTGADKSPRNLRKQPHCLPFSAASAQYASRDQASRTPSPNADRSSSAFSSPRYCSSKAEQPQVAMQEQSETRIQSASPTLLTQCNSQCSGSTNDLNAGRNEIAALKSSHAEVCWESIKLRKTASKSFTIKNMSHRKLTLKMEIIGPGFQITGTESNCQLGLQAHECRTISITFCPTMVGPAYGNVCFYSAREVDERHLRIVRLVGFGGNTTMSLQELSRGPVGCPFLSFGNVRDITTQSMATQQRSFVIYNRGPLNGMAVVRIKATAKDDNVFEKPNIVIWPEKCVIGPDSYQQISVTFQPRRSDLKKLLRKQAPVITIAMLEVIYGDDPNRQRIAALIDRTDPTYKPLDFLLADFVNEQPLDFTDFKESSKNVNDLFSSFKSEEIALTMDRCTLNETVESEMDLMMTGLDETMLFRTLMPVESNATEQTQAVSRTATGCSGHTPVKIVTSSRNSWSIRPRQLFMNPFGTNHTQTLIIRSDLMTPQTFVLVTNFRHLLEVRPESGEIRPGEEVHVQVKIRKVFIPSDDILLGVYIENDKIEVPIHVDRAALGAKSGVAKYD